MRCDRILQEVLGQENVGRVRAGNRTTKTDKCGRANGQQKYIRAAHLRLASMGDLQIRYDVALKRYEQMLDEGAPVCDEARSSEKPDKLAVWQAVLLDVQREMMAVEFEQEQIKEGLEKIRFERYYRTVHDKYLLGESDETIAEKIGCDVSTVRRNRNKLLCKLAVLFYGLKAIG